MESRKIAPMNLFTEKKWRYKQVGLADTVGEGEARRN